MKYDVPQPTTATLAPAAGRASASSGNRATTPAQSSGCPATSRWRSLSGLNVTAAPW